MNDSDSTSKDTDTTQLRSTAATGPAMAARIKVDTTADSWLHDFYKECGREVTLAYTTLNQMKNWAIVVQAAIIAAVASFGRQASHLRMKSPIIWVSLLSSEPPLPICLHSDFSFAQSCVT